MTSARGTISHPGQGVAVDNPLGGRLVFRARGSETNGVLTVLESVAPPQTGPPLHFHTREDEVVYPLEGTLRFRLGEDEQQAAAGACVFIPRLLVHTWQNVAATPARLLVVFTPAAVELERFFERYAGLGRDRLDVDAFAAFGRDAGMEVVGPPLGPAPPGDR